MSGRQVRYDLYLNSNVKESLRQTEVAAVSLDRQMESVRRNLYAIGTGFGAYRLFQVGKDWLKDIADLETGMLRIKNASENITEGVKNQLFIQDAVKRFKLDLGESVDAYGQFLFKIKNANLGSGLERQLYENILTIGKVAALPQSEIDSTVRNIGIMLGEGILEARHLRMLSYVHPQIIPFLSKAMGLKDDDMSGLLKGDETTASQKLSQLISSGKLTKSALDARIIIEAIQNYKDSVADKIPETLDTYQSNLNELSNKWLELKKILGDDLKPEILSFFSSIKDGIQWLEEHKKQIYEIGGNIITILKYYAEWRIGMLALQAPFALMGLFRGELTRVLSIGKLYGIQTIQQTALYEKQAIAVAELTASVTALSREEMLRNARVAAGTEMGAAVPFTGKAGLTMLPGLTTLGGALLVALTAASIAELVVGLKTVNKDTDVPFTKQIKDFFIGKSVWQSEMETSMNDASKRADAKSKNLAEYKNLLPSEEDAEFVKRMKSLGINMSSRQLKELNDTYKAAGDNETPLEKLSRLYGGSLAKTGTSKYEDMVGMYKGRENDPLVFKDALIEAIRSNVLGAHSNLLEDVLRQEKLNGGSEDFKGLGKFKGKFGDKEKIRGNSVTNIHIDIKEMNGVKGSSFNIKSDKDMKKVMDETGDGFVRKLSAAVNDSQIIAGKK